MSMEPWESVLENVYFAEALQGVADNAIQEFTAERLQFYYIANPNLAAPAFDALQEAQSLLASHPRASLVIAATAMELAIKVVLLRPIVSGLVHIEELAGFITELVTKQTGMERIQDLLTAILAQFGGVDLKSFARQGSTKALWKEMQDVQTVRNVTIHRGDPVSVADANLAIAVAATLLNELFPQVLSRLDLHLHEPGIVCGKTHGTTVPVYFSILGNAPSFSGDVVLDIERLDLDAMPETISGKLGKRFSNEDAIAIRAASPGLPMWITSTPIQYTVTFAPDTTTFTGTRVAALQK